MRKLLLATATLAAIALPAAANAQYYDYDDRQDLREEQRDVREEERELERARRFGDYDDIRDEREDLSEAREDYREERHEERYEDYGGYGGYGRDDGYYGGDDGYYAPRGYAGRPVERGYRLGRPYFDSRFQIGNLGRYGLYRPRYGHARWIRHGRDILLVDTRSGVVLEVRRGRYW